MNRWMCLAALVGGSLLMMPNWAQGEETAAALRQRGEAVLAKLSGELRLAGLGQPVHVVRDRWGIAHIYAQNQHDLFYAQGFVAAQDRLFQIDLWRRIGLGETAEIFGEEAIEADRFARLIRYRGDMQAEWQSYSADTQEIATAFTQGINAFIDQAGENLPLEFQMLGYTPKKWQPEDVLGRMSGIIMTNNWQKEVARAMLVHRVGAEQAQQLAPTDPPRGFAPAEKLDLSLITPDIFRGYLAATRGLKFTTSTSESNNWVVDGTLSESGQPLLASDPHRATALPSLRYMVHLHAPGWNVIGAGEPGLPGVAIGHNERIAWGFTIVGTDQADLYVETTDPADSSRYRVGDGWEPMHIVRETIRVRGKAEAVPIELRYTRHGPVIYQDEKQQAAFALKWAGSEPGGAAYLGSLAVGRANHRDEFLKALESWKIPGLNFVYADVTGDTGWIATALTPIRNGWDGLLPVPGAEGKYKWQGFLPVKEYPQEFNPPTHYRATANHNILPPGYKHAIAYEWSAPHRFRRIKQRLEGQAKFSLDDFKSIQHDNTSLPAQTMIAVLKSARLPAELAPYQAVLTNWDGVLSLDAQAGPLYAAWMQELLSEFYADTIPKDPRLERADLRSIDVVLVQLQNPQAWRFGANPEQGRDELLQKTFAAAVARVKKLQGDDPRQWNWGKLHTASFTHAAAGISPAHAQALNLGPVPRPGDVYTPNNTKSDENFQQVHGASYRQVFDLADWDRGMATSTPGQSGQLGSPHYADLLPLWAAGEYFPLAYSREKVESVAQNRLTLQPAGK